MYLLNIIPALICDILLFKYIQSRQSIGHNNKGVIQIKSNKLFSRVIQVITEKNNKQISLIVSIIMYL